MKVFLMHRDRDVDLRREPPNERELTQDLELSRLFDAMALGDSFLFEVAKRAVLSSLNDTDEIVYRQQVLRDCLARPSVVREMYDIAVESINGEKRAYGGFRSRYPDGILHRSLEVLELLVGMLRKLRRIADEDVGGFRSEGFTALFGMLTAELDDEYFRIIEGHLRRLRFQGGVLISAALGKGNRGESYVLRKPRHRKRSWTERICIGNRSPYTYTISDRDESGARALTELRGRGINLVANALAQSTDHILSFFQMLRSELGFYVGCQNLHERLLRKGEPTCYPVPLGVGKPALSCHGLYDACLTLSVEHRVVGNDVNADNKSLVMVTGANQGGKSTFLRSMGLAQLMMQAGMFVAAESFSASVCEGVFTHYKREEDVTMTSGKLDEELSRMSDIADNIGPRCVLLCNESFAATNEREGSEIASQIVRALLEADIRIFFVTHSFDLAQRLRLQKMDIALFLRAERRPDGGRSFRVLEGDPLPTSYGEDLYNRIFGATAYAAPAARSTRVGQA